MTNYSKASLKTFFETGDVPTGQNYADFIDSCVNVAETAIQSMAGTLSTTELVTPRVSAAAGNFTSTVAIAGITSVADIYVNTIRSSAMVTGLLNVTGDVSANNGNVFASTIRLSNGIISAAGTTQATGAALIYTVNIGAGINDGQTTGFLLPANKQGLIQYLYNGTVSANLWPCTGGQINALSSNAAFAMAASTLYTIIHTRASGYAVK